MPSDTGTVAALDKHVLFERIGGPEEVAALVAFLASDEAALMCGSLVEITVRKRWLEASVVTALSNVYRGLGSYSLSSRRTVRQELRCYASQIVNKISRLTGRGMSTSRAHASRGVYLITNSRQPSRYIRELCEIAGDEVRYETIEGAALRQCPVRLVGQMVGKRNRNGTVFHGCNQFPAAGTAKVFRRNRRRNRRASRPPAPEIHSQGVIALIR